MILLDTAPLVALCDERDSLHRQALADLDRLARRPLVLCQPVLTEACFLLQGRAMRARLASILEALSIRPLALEDEAGTWRRVLAWLDRYAEHDPDFADGFLVIASALQRRSRVWTYDSEFRTTWRREDGTRVPLAR
ncbi:MAG TPA: PIN domain-containing protein [Anaeromyxobacter sp.]|nr:PIN domain-containing protein [Anaeromyxobacter sp.]